MRLIDADALSAKFNNDNIKGCFRTDADGVIRLLADAPTVKLNELIPQTILDEIKAELKENKRTIEKLAFKDLSKSDYTTGYISALSYVEGYIAHIEIREGLTHEQI